MKKLTKGIAMVAAAALISVPAFAGKKQPAEVQVDLEGMFAAGDMTTARRTKNSEAFIGCGARHIEDGAGGIFYWAFCQAEDAEAESVTCFTTNQDLVESIRGVSDYSYITFSWTEDEEGAKTCTRTGYSTQSFYLGRHVKANKLPD